MSNIKYSPKLPLKLDANNLFEVNTDVLDNVKQNLKMIILTSPGEKIMDPFFGVGIKKYLFDINLGKVTISDGFVRGQKIFSIENFETKIETEIKNQVAIYSPNIKISYVSTTVQDLIMNISIGYNYRNFIDDVLELQLTS